MSAVDQQTDAMLNALRYQVPAERCALIASQPDPQAVLVGLTDHVTRQCATNADDALEIAAIVLELAEAIELPLVEARVQRARSRAFAYVGEYDQALLCAREAELRAAKAGLDDEVGRARLASMHALTETGRLSEAIQVGESARQAFLENGFPELAARADVNLGVVYQRGDRAAEAVECFERARDPLSNEPLILGHLDNNQGEALVVLNEFERAEDSFRRARDAFDAAGAALTSGIAEGNLADLAVRQGRLGEALEHFERARRQLEAAGSPAHCARLLAEQADAKSVLGMPEEALREYRVALRRLDEYGQPLEAARARAGLGLLHLRRDELTDAETTLAAAATAFEDLENRTAKARVDLLRADLAARRGRDADAKALALGALGRLIDRPVDAVFARHLLARLAAERGEMEVAKGELDLAISVASELDIAPLLADLYHASGRVNFAQGRVEQAAANLMEAARQLERIRDSLQAIRFRSALHGGRIEIFEDLVIALMAQEIAVPIEQFFAVVEQAKSRGLLDSTRSTDSHAPAVGDAMNARRHEPMWRQRASVMGRLNGYYSRLADESFVVSDSRETARWRREIRVLEDQLSEFDSRLAAAGEVLPPGSSAPLPFAEARARMDAKTAMVEYFVARDRVLALAWTRESDLVVPLEISTNPLFSMIERMRFQIDRAVRPGALDGARADRLIAATRRECADLYDALLAPVKPLIADAQRLVILPHGQLRILPFHALWDGDQYLVERYEVSTAPSMSILATLHERPRIDCPHRMLVIGVPNEHAPDILKECESLPRSLPSGHVERRYAGAATVEWFLHSSGDADIIHLACHGYFNQENPEGSGLRLGDRWMTPRDLDLLESHAELLVLSGCETGINLPNAGDELTGFMQGFFRAGVSSLLVSLWRVSDSVAAELMTSFYEFWEKNGLDPSCMGRSWRCAQQEMIARHPHPAAWAPFTLIGRS